MYKSTSGVMVAFSAIALSIAATGCAPAEPNAEVYSFSNTEECMESGSFSRSECEAQIQEAIAKHNVIAPQFASIEECEKEYGKNSCSPPQSQAQDSGYFVPMMMGFMMARMMDGSGLSSGATQPLYQNSSQRGTNNFTTANGRAMSKGMTTANTRTVRAPTRATNVSRGGMGSSARGTSGGG